MRVKIRSLDCVCDKVLKPESPREYSAHYRGSTFESTNFRANKKSIFVLCRIVYPKEPRDGVCVCLDEIKLLSLLMGSLMHNVNKHYFAKQRVCVCALCIFCGGNRAQ